MAEKIPALAEKLDEDLDKFLSELKPRKVGEDAWPVDRWEEEMEKHPLFMTKAVGDGQELPPLVEALQQLKFDPDENTPEELAISYKEEGNEYYKLKKYKFAITSYTEALKINCKDRDINAIIYTNRAAAEFRLGNFQKALKDAMEAINRKPIHTKAILRAAQCCLKLEIFDDCLLWCEKGLNVEKDIELRKSFQNLKKEATNKKELIENHKIIALAKEAENIEEWNLIQSVIKKRGIRLKIDKNDKIPDWWLNTKFGNSKVLVTDENCLIWPVLILYPEYNVTDFIQHFHEDSCFYDHLQKMFCVGNEPAWDKEHKYKLNHLNIYYAHEDVLFPVDERKQLKNILSAKNYIIQDGVPSFFITVKNSDFDCYWQTKGLNAS